MRIVNMGNIVLAPKLVRVGSTYTKQVYPIALFHRAKKRYNNLTL